MEEAEHQPILLAEEGFIYFPEDLTVGKVYQSSYSIIYAEINGVRIQLDEQTADQEAKVWHVLLEDGRPVILGRVFETEVEQQSL